MHRSRRFPLSVTLLLFIFPTLVRSQASNQTASATDSSISYVGSGWTESAGHMFTNDDAASFSLDFTGSAVYWYSRKLYDGATTTVTLDGSSATLDLSDGMSQNSPSVEAVVFSRSGLDASQSHRFTVALEGLGSNGVGSVLENWQIVYTVGTTSSPTTTTSSSPTPATTPSSSSNPTASSSSEATSTSTPTTTPSPSLSTTSRLITSVLSGSTFVSTSQSIVTFTIFTSSSTTSDPDFARASSSTLVASTSSGTSTESTTAAPQPSSGSNLSAIIGGTVGGILAVIVVVVALLCCRRRRRIAVQRFSQSATPFFTTRNRINGSTVGSLLPPSSKHPLNSEIQLPLRERSGEERLYVLVDPVTLRPARNGAVFQATSLGESSSLSPTSIARRWKWARSGTLQDTVLRSPQDTALSSTSLTAVAQEYEMSNRSSAVALVPVPLSSAEARQSSIIDDPPPVYRR
ncbi:hypothetical protein ACEPAH_3785 [Sanghuangporus vaninii]